MNLSFLDPDNNEKSSLFTYEIPISLIDEINNNLNLPKNHQNYFIFNKFVDFNHIYHGFAIEYFFTHMITSIETKAVTKGNNYQYSYKFIDKPDIMSNLNKSQLIFICAILDNLNLHTLLLAVADLLTNDMKIPFGTVKNQYKDGMFKMTIAPKNI